MVKIWKLSACKALKIVGFLGSGPRGSLKLRGQGDEEESIK